MCVCNPLIRTPWCGKPGCIAPAYAPPEPKPEKRVKGVYIGAPACFALEEALRHVCDAFNVYGREEPCGCYIVGSCLERADWRDVDVRMILHDAVFAQIFPDAHIVTASWEFDARWLLLTTAISERLSRLTGLPIDFQFQPMTFANKQHKGPRNAVGMRMSREVG